MSERKSVCVRERESDRERVRESDRETVSEREREIEWQACVEFPQLDIAREEGKREMEK